MIQALYDHAGLMSCLVLMAVLSGFAAYWFDKRFAGISAGLAVNYTAFWIGGAVAIIGVDAVFLVESHGEVVFGFWHFLVLALVIGPLGGVFGMVGTSVLNRLSR